MWNADYYEAETLNELCRRVGKDHFKKEYGEVEIKKVSVSNAYGYEASLSEKAIFDIQKAAEAWRKFYERMDLVSSVIEFFWKNQNIYKLEKKYNDMPGLAMLQYRVCTTKNLLMKMQAGVYEPKSPYKTTFCIPQAPGITSTHYINIEA